MRVVIAAVGRLKAGPDTELYDRYAKRCSFGKQIGISDLSIIEIPEARAEQRNDRMRREAEQLLSKIRLETSDVLIAMDERGLQLTSDGLAKKLRTQLDCGSSRLVFAIGGPDGHGTPLLEAARETMSLSKMTLPHGLARIVLVEQIYRAVTILTGHPYHRP